MQSPPVTPKRKRRGSDDDHVEGPMPIPRSAQKKAKATTKTPSKSTLAKAEAAKKKEWKAAWNVHAQSSYWVKDDSYRQEANTFEIHRSDAMQFYRLQAAGMDTLPPPPGSLRTRTTLHIPRSYSHEAVLMLVSRKHAMLAGFHEKGLREHELLRQARLLQRTSNKKRQPHLWKIVNRGEYVDPWDWESTPSSSWETPIWEDGRVIGHWLNDQFDPNIGPEGCFPWPDSVPWVHRRELSCREEALGIGT